MSVQIYIFETINHVPWILVARQSEYNLKKMKVACPIFKYYAHLPDTCNYVKIKLFYETIERKVLHQKYHLLEF